VIRATAAVLLTNTFLVMQLHTRDVFCILQFVFFIFLWICFMDRGWGGFS
jgi:hypothetical protein